MVKYRGRPDDLLTARPWVEPTEHLTAGMRARAVVDCGWGRVLFGQTFDDPRVAADLLREEEEGRRDICLYLRDPQVVVAHAPHELFIDPSYTYRLRLHQYRPARQSVRGVRIRTMRSADDADATDRIYASCGMVTAPVETLWENQRTRTFTYLIAEDIHTQEPIGTVTGIDHVRAFGDPENGTSLWCLAVDPRCTKPGVGEALVRFLAERYIARGRAYLDLSVLADNAPAIALYEKLGFERVGVFCVKRKNPINEPLFAQPAENVQELNPYARIVADEARRRGIAVEVADADAGILSLSLGGRTVMTRESLSELTNAVAMSICDDKRATRRVLTGAGLRVPPGRTATFDAGDLAFLKDHGSVVVKPARGEQGRGITVGVTDEEHLERARAFAAGFCPDVLIEACVEGRDLRIVVIDHAVVAAAIREPATVIGTGIDSIRRLIEAQSRRRRAATGGESSIPVDAVTAETIAAAGYDLDSILPAGVALAVRRTANLHTGGTIHDVTADLHPELIDVAVRASRALAIPVVGLDLMVESPDRPSYVFIEANERPGLANHEPQPTAARFIDLLFPSTQELPHRWDAPRPAAAHRP